MTYIINPWFFYLSSLSDNFQTLSICVFIIAIIAMFIRILDKLKWKETWLVLFGARFVINYLVHGFNNN